MRFHPIDNILRDAKLFQDTHADLHMRSLNLVIHRLTNIMHQPRLARRCNICPELGRESSCQIGYFK